MPKLIENVLIGDRVRLAGEDVSEADAKGVRPEVFAAEAEAPPADGVVPVVGEDPEGVASEEPAAVEAAPAKSTGRKSSSTK